MDRLSLLLLGIVRVRAPLLILLVVVSCGRPSAHQIDLGQPIAAEGVTHAERVTNGVRAVEGSRWNSPHAALIEDGSELVFDFGASQPVAGVYIQADNNDAFVLELSEDGEAFDELWRARTVDSPGLQSRSSPALDASGRFLRLRAIGGDASVSVSELQLFRTLPDPWPPRVPWRPDSLRSPQVGFVVFVFAVMLLLFLLAFRRSAATALLSVDVRTLGFSRIAIASLLLFDLAKRSTELTTWYTHAGLLPNAMLAERPFRTHAYSFLFYVDSPTWVSAVFTLIALVYLCFLLGIYTRFFHVLSWVCLVSLQVRTDVITNGGDFVFANMLLWTAFLPMGAKFSIDERRRAKAGKPSTRSPYVSWAFLVVLLQLAVIYYFNAIQKTGVTWKDGTAVYWLAHQERIVTWFGVWMRETMPLWVFQGLTYFALAIEYALPWLILSPWGRPWTRRVAILLGVALHVGIAVVANLGVFSLVMISYLTLLISREDWEWFRVRWAARRGMNTPVVRALALSPPDKMNRSRSRWRWVVGPILAALVFVATSQILIENSAVPRQLRPSRPQWMSVAMMTFRLYQGWGMFAANAPRDDFWIVVDAVTEDGRHLDPLNDVASRHSDPSLRTVPPRLGQNYYWCDYVSQIVIIRSYRSGLADWVFRHHERTGNEEDRIVAFRVYEVSHDSPLPRSDGPTNTNVEVLLSRRRK